MSFVDCFRPPDTQTLQNRWVCRVHWHSPNIYFPRGLADVANGGWPIGADDDGFGVGGAVALDRDHLALADANDIRPDQMDCAGITPYWD